MVRRAIVLGVVLAGMACSVHGQDESFKNLRYQEDWSFLGEPGATTKNWFPDLKWIDLGSGWHLTLGGQERLRAQGERNLPTRGKGFGGKPIENDFLLHRLRLSADFRHDSGWRGFLEVLDARVGGVDTGLGPRGIDRNNLDVQNAFGEYSEGDTTVRAGRMELQYGHQRFISPLDWGNTRRTFQGALVSQKLDGGQVDVFATHPVVINVNANDNEDDSRWFSGVYSTFDLGEQEGIDLYALALNETSSLPPVLSEAARPGNFDTYTAGVRHHRTAGAFDWEAEYAHQFGQFAGDNISADSLAAAAGWTFADVDMKPRVALNVDWASGDSNPTDGKRETFNQLFPLGHAWLGYMDIVGRQNILAISPNVTMQVAEGTRFRVAWHDFHLDQSKDALYNAGGAPTLRDPTGKSGDHVGDELDLTVAWAVPALSPHGNLLVGYSHFDPGRFVSSQTSGRGSSLVYTQLSFTF